MQMFGQCHSVHRLQGDNRRYKKAGFKKSSCNIKSAKNGLESLPDYLWKSCTTDEWWQKRQWIPGGCVWLQQTAAYNTSRWGTWSEGPSKTCSLIITTPLKCQAGSVLAEGTSAGINSLILALSQVQHRPGVRHFSLLSLIHWETRVGNKHISHSKHFGALH